MTNNSRAGDETLSDGDLEVGGKTTRRDAQENCHRLGLNCRLQLLRSIQGSEFFDLPRAAVQVGSGNGSELGNQAALTRLSV